jgi:hypothetical protein
MQTHGNSPQVHLTCNNKFIEIPRPTGVVRGARRRVLYKICKKVYFARARAARARCVGSFNSYREEHCVWDPKQIEILDVVLGNTREAQAAGFQKAFVDGKGRLENEEIRQAREEQDIQHKTEEAERKLAQREQDIQQAKQREAEMHHTKQVAGRLQRRQEEDTLRETLSRIVSERAIAGATEELMNMTSDIAKDMIEVVREVCAMETKRAKREGRAEQGLKGIRNTFLDGTKSVQTLANELDRRQTQLRVRARI